MKIVLDKGFILKDKAIAIAKKMIEEGFELAVISKITELTIEEIEKLRNN